jgi:hypothetical protein
MGDWYCSNALEVDVNCADLFGWFDCDASTGTLRWKRKPNRRIRIGSVAGRARPDGYIRVTINGKQFLAHRIIWAMHRGYWPSQLLDHIDRNPSNNAIENLREATYSQNAMNTTRKGGLASGVTGVRLAMSGKWTAYIKVNKAHIHLGNFDSLDVAIKARRAAEQDYFGEFSAITGLPVESETTNETPVEVL